MLKNLLLTVVLLVIGINDALTQTSLGAKNDFFSTIPVSSVTGVTTASVLANDTVNAVPNSANLSNVTLTWLSAAPAGFTLNASGTITVAAGTAPDNYLINYQICGATNTTLCRTAYATIYVDKDSDGDEVGDRTDTDDDNDGILDANECNTDLFAIYTASNFTDSTRFLEIRPSDFGLTTFGVKNVNATHDYSAFFGLPTGSIIATVENANVHPSADQFYVGLVTGTSARTRIKFSGTVGIYIAVEHGQQYISRVERGITFLDGLTPATGFFNLGTQTTGGNWQSGNIDQYYYVRHTATSTENAVLAYANINSQTMPKHVELSTNNTVSTQYSTFFIRIFPECDLDKDGIPNRLDLDADNDGCPDVFEGAGTYNYSHVTNAGGTVSVGAGSTAQNLNFCADNSCVDANGVPATPGPSGQATGSVYDKNTRSNFCITSLPVDLLSFSVTNNSKTIQLEWTTASEYNNKGFEVERSPDGHLWKTISFINTAVANGNSNIKLYYNFTDEAPINGKNFYRLKQVDADGRYVYSDVRWTTLNQDNSIRVYPNPVKSHINISGLKGDEVIGIYDATGRKLKSLNNNTNLFTHSVVDLNEGIYCLRIISSNGTSKSISFIKTK